MLEISELHRQRRSQLDAINVSTQRLKTLAKEKDENFSSFLADLRALETLLVRKIKTMRVEKEYLIAEKNKVTTAISLVLITPF